METVIERREAMRGGNGHVIITHILSDKEMSGKCRLFAQITLEPTCSIGYHEHHGESETFYIVSGEGIYNDNGTSHPVRTGDVVYARDCGHAIANSGYEDLIFTALIILD